MKNVFLDPSGHYEKELSQQLRLTVVDFLQAGEYSLHTSRLCGLVCASHICLLTTGKCVDKYLTSYLAEWQNYLAIFLEFM